jgi:hypothetical protein
MQSGLFATCYQFEHPARRHARLLDQLHQRQQHLPVGLAERRHGPLGAVPLPLDDVVVSFYGGGPLQGILRRDSKQIAPEPPLQPSTAPKSDNLYRY